MRVRVAKENTEVVRVAAEEAGLDVFVKDDLSQVLFSVAKLRRVCDPFKDGVWDGVPLGRVVISQAIREGRLLGDSWDARASGADWTWMMHVERVAFLVVHPDPKPIEVDVGIPSLGCHVDWPVIDGNHRLAAALYRGDKTILVSPAGEERLIRKFMVKGLTPASHESNFPKS